MTSRIFSLLMNLFNLDCQSLKIKFTLWNCMSLLWRLVLWSSARYNSFFFLVSLVLMSSPFRLIVTPFPTFLISKCRSFVFWSRYFWIMFFKRVWLASRFFCAVSWLYRTKMIFNYSEYRDSICLHTFQTTFVKRFLYRLKNFVPFRIESLTIVSSKGNVHEIWEVQNRSIR